MTSTVPDMVHCARFQVADALCQVFFSTAQVALSVLSSEIVFFDEFWEWVKCLCLCLHLCLKRLLESNFCLSICLFFCCCCGGVFDVPYLRSILIYFSCFVCNGVPARQSDGILAQSKYFASGECPYVLRCLSFDPLPALRRQGQVLVEAIFCFVGTKDLAECTHWIALCANMCEDVLVA